MPETFDDYLGEVHSTATLPRVRIVDAEFERPDGSEIVLDIDLLDNTRTGKSPLGPISTMQKGMNYIKVW